jgi:serine/threonine-protein kinase
VSTSEALGKYEVLGKLAETATAELFVARTTGAGTPQKFVVIKRLRRVVATDVERVRAFLVRARLATRLEHQNVAAMLEVGKLGASYFCAMEFVDGETVRAIIDHARSKKIPIPVRVVLAIAAGATMGMRHAHECRGQDGNVLGIIHGDITSTSVMVSREGVVKLVGFGLAPDAATVDRATDLQGLGAVLWELLTLQPLAAGNGAPPPPSSKRLDVPKELDGIVLKLLAKAPADHYDYAGEVLAEIEALAAKLDIAISTNDLARAMRLWFADASTAAAAELRPIMVETEQAPPDASAAGAAGAVDTMLDEVVINAAAIRSAVAAANVQPSTRRKSSTGVQPPPPGAERETFEQIRDRIMANARPRAKTAPPVAAPVETAPEGDKSAGTRKKSETLNPTINQYSYITAVGGKASEPLRVATTTPAEGQKVVVDVGPGADTAGTDAKPQAEIEARARAVAEAAARVEATVQAERAREEREKAEDKARSEEKAKILAEQRAKAEALAQQRKRLDEANEAEELARAAKARDKSAEDDKANDSAKTAPETNGKSAKAAAAAAAENAEIKSKKSDSDDIDKTDKIDRAARDKAEKADQAKADKAKADKAKAEAKPAVEADDEEHAPPPGRPPWLVPAVLGAVALVGIVLFVATRGGGSKEEPPKPRPVPVAAVADAPIKVAAAPDAAPPPDAPEVAAAPPDAAPPPDAAKVAVAPVDAPVEVAAVPVDAGHRHHKEDAGTETVTPPKPHEDTRSIEELYTAGELSKVNKACPSTTHFNATILFDCGMAACTAKDAALAKRWANALSGQPRADVIAKCHDVGIDL